MRVQSTVDIPVARQTAWDVVTDPSRWPSFMAGTTQSAVVAGEPARGLRARYRLLVRLGPAEVGGVIEVSEYDEPAEMAWFNVTGPTQRGRWRLRELTPTSTRVTLRVSYQAPGTYLLSLLADRLAARSIRRNLDTTLRNLRDQLTSAPT